MSLAGFTSLALVPRLGVCSRMNLAVETSQRVEAARMMHVHTWVGGQRPSSWPSAARERLLLVVEGPLVEHLQRTTEPRADIRTQAGDGVGWREEPETDQFIIADR